MSCPSYVAQCQWVQSTMRVFQHSGEFVLRNVGNEAVLVPIRNRVGDLDSVYVMSDVAVRVWALIDGARDVDAIVDALLGEYDVERGRAAQDVNDLLQALEEAELIRLA
jgi:hypothetical protein